MPSSSRSSSWEPMPKINLDPDRDPGEDTDADAGLESRFSRVVIDEIDESTGLPRYDPAELESERRGWAASLESEYEFDRDGSYAPGSEDEEWDEREGSCYGYDDDYDDGGADAEFQKMFNERFNKLDPGLFARTACSGDRERAASLGSDYGSWDRDDRHASGAFPRGWDESQHSFDHDNDDNNDEESPEHAAPAYVLEIETAAIGIDYDFGLGFGEHPWMVTFESSKPIEFSEIGEPRVIIHGLDDDLLAGYACDEYQNGSAAPVLVEWNEEKGTYVAFDYYIPSPEHPPGPESERAPESKSESEEDGSTYKLALEIGDLDLYGMNANAQGPWTLEVEGTKRFSRECTKIPAPANTTATHTEPSLPDCQQDGRTLYQLEYFPASDFVFTFTPPCKPKSVVDHLYFIEIKPGDSKHRTTVLRELQRKEFWKDFRRQYPDRIVNPFEYDEPLWTTLSLPDSPREVLLRLAISSQLHSFWNKPLVEIRIGLALQGKIFINLATRQEYYLKGLLERKISTSITVFESLAPPKSDIPPTPWTPGPRPTPFNPFYRLDLTLEVAASNMTAYFQEAGDWLVHWETTATILDIKEGARDPKSKLGQILWHIASTLEFLRTGRPDLTLTQWPEELFRDVEPLLARVLGSLAVYRDWHGCELFMLKAERAVEEIRQRLKAIQAEKEGRGNAGDA